MISAMEGNTILFDGVILFQEIPFEEDKDTPRLANLAILLHQRNTAAKVILYNETAGLITAINLEEKMYHSQVGMFSRFAPASSTTPQRETPPPQQRRSGGQHQPPIHYYASLSQKRIAYQVEFETKEDWNNFATCISGAVFASGGFCNPCITPLPSLQSEEFRNELFSSPRRSERNLLAAAAAQSEKDKIFFAGDRITVIITPLLFLGTSTSPDQFQPLSEKESRLLEFETEIVVHDARPTATADGRSSSGGADSPKALLDAQLLSLKVHEACLVAVDASLTSRDWPWLQQLEAVIKKKRDTVGGKVSTVDSGGDEVVLRLYIKDIAVRNVVRQRAASLEAVRQRGASRGPGGEGEDQHHDDKLLSRLRKQGATAMMMGSGIGEKKDEAAHAADTAEQKHKRDQREPFRTEPEIIEEERTAAVEQQTRTKGRKSADSMTRGHPSAEETAEATATPVEESADAAAAEVQAKYERKLARKKQRLMQLEADLMAREDDVATKEHDIIERETNVSNLRSQIEIEIAQLQNEKAAWRTVQQQQMRKEKSKQDTRHRGGSGPNDDATPLLPQQSPQMVIAASAASSYDRNFSFSIAYDVFDERSLPPVFFDYYPVFAWLIHICTRYVSAAVIIMMQLAGLGLLITATVKLKSAHKYWPFMVYDAIGIINFAILMSQRRVYYAHLHRLLQSTFSKSNVAATSLAVSTIFGNQCLFLLLPVVIAAAAFTPLLVVIDCDDMPYTKFLCPAIILSLSGGSLSLLLPASLLLLTRSVFFQCVKHGVIGSDSLALHNKQTTRQVIAQYQHIKMLLSASAQTWSRSVLLLLVSLLAVCLYSAYYVVLNHSDAKVDTYQLVLALVVFFVSGIIFWVVLVCLSNWYKATKRIIGAITQHADRWSRGGLIIDGGTNRQGIVGSAAGAGGYHTLDIPEDERPSNRSISGNPTSSSAAAINASPGNAPLAMEDFVALQSYFSYCLESGNYCRWPVNLIFWRRIGHSSDDDPTSPAFHFNLWPMAHGNIYLFIPRYVAPLWLAMCVIAILAIPIVLVYDDGRS